jgi:phosphatidate cytidylyltransferase
MTELGLRIASAAVLGPLVIAIVWWGNPGFALLAAAMAGIVMWEWNRITREGHNDAASWLAIGAATLAVLSVAYGSWIAGIVLMLCGAIIGQAMAGRAGGSRILWLGIFYASLPAAALVILRADAEWGLVVVGLLLCVVWATDIGAYFAGRGIGGPKLWPAVSPKKTWSGAIGGALAALGAGMLFLSLAIPDYGPGVVQAGLIVLLSVVSQLGDLGESALKRRFDVKDSSDLIPGHGGVMDRVDALVAAAVVAAVIGVIRAGSDAAAGGVLLW